MQQFLLVGGYDFQTSVSDQYRYWPIRKSKISAVISIGQYSLSVAHFLLRIFDTIWICMPKSLFLKVTKEASSLRALHYVWFFMILVSLENVKKLFWVVARLPQRLKSDLAELYRGLAYRAFFLNSSCLALFACGFGIYFYSFSCWIFEMLNISQHFIFLFFGISN